MDINSTTRVNAPQSAAGAFGAVSSDDFFKIIFEELSNQDPTQPQDTGALLDQLSTLRSIESDMDLTDRMASISAQDQLSEAGSLIGALITGRDQELYDASGVVTSVTRTDDGPLLNLDTGQRVPLSQVDEIVGLNIIEELAKAAGQGGGDEG